MQNAHQLEEVCSWVSAVQVSACKLTESSHDIFHLPESKQDNNKFLSGQPGWVMIFFFHVLLQISSFQHYLTLLHTTVMPFTCLFSLIQCILSTLFEVRLKNIESKIILHSKTSGSWFFLFNTCWLLHCTLWVVKCHLLPKQYSHNNVSWIPRQSMLVLKEPCHNDDSSLQLICLAGHCKIIFKLMETTKILFYDNNIHNVVCVPVTHNDIWISLTWNWETKFANSTFSFIVSWNTLMALS